MLSRHLTSFHRMLPRDLIRAIILVGMIALLVVMTGCSRIPLSSLWELRKFDFENFDPATLRVAMHLPAAYSVRRNALSIDVKVKRDGEQAHVERFTMRESKDSEDLAGLPAVSSTEGRWMVLKLDSAEVARLVAFRQRLVNINTPTDKVRSGKSSIELGAKPQVCRNGAPSEGTPRVVGAMRWIKEKDYITVMRESDLNETLKSLDDFMDISSVPAC